MLDAGQETEVTREELANRARAMIPMLRDRAPEAEKNRRLPDITPVSYTHLTLPTKA